MKKLIVWSLVISMCACLLTACGNGQERSSGNYTDEMKIPYSCNLSEEEVQTAWSGRAITRIAPILAPWISTTWSPAIP